MEVKNTTRREALTTAAAAFTTSLFTGRVRGANDRVAVGFIGLDAVCISTPDHWHAYMTVEACKAGKDVYVEKPACVYVEEGQKMVEAARKYKKIVQAGTMQRAGGDFKKAAESGKSGK